MKRSADQLRFIITATSEIEREIIAKAKADHQLTLIQCDQLRDIERSRRNAQINLNQLKMRSWGKG